ncbi:MAG TPA: hypothetical protein VNH22_05855 [Blastocatellia bacterium]|jgi:hypothetical protein|nr:hypothetical protein [Blastocatellia bacterium]
MKDSGKDYSEYRLLSPAVLIYCGVLFAGFVIGLYGLFTLLWLASATAQRAGYAMFY